MAKIVIERAPPTAVPLRFLLTTPLWGLVAGLLLVVDGGSALQSRWAPATLALVHALTLGVLGNAMFGSLLQFVPAAAGGRVLGGAVAARTLYGLLNVGALLLVTGMRATRPTWLMPGGGAIVAACVLLACMVLPGLGRTWSGPGGTIAAPVAAALRPTRAGVAGSVIAALVTVSLGLGLLSAWIGQRGLPAMPWTDVHASWGLIGWGLGLIASVGAVVLPMFQGTRPVPARVLYACLALLAGVLLAGTGQVATTGSTQVLRWGAVLALATLAGGGLWWQRQARYTRNGWLVRAWRTGMLALGLGAVAVAIGGQPVLAGTLLLGVAFPWLVLGMQLEIVAFLGWIELHRRCGRGVRLPAVHALLTDAEKGRVFVAFSIAAMAMLAAAAWPPLGRVAGVALMASHALLWWRLHSVGGRVRAFNACGHSATPKAETPHAP